MDFARAGARGGVISAVMPNAEGLAGRIEGALAVLPGYSVFDFLGYRLEGTHVALTGKVTRAPLKDAAERAILGTAHRGGPGPVGRVRLARASWSRQPG